VYNIMHPRTPVVLTSIAVTTPPDKITYTTGETLDLTGLVVTAAYSDGSTHTVTGYDTSPAEGTTLDTAGTVTVTVSYTEDGVTETDTFDVTVHEPVVLTSIAVTTLPDKVTQRMGRPLDFTGLVVTATYSDGSSHTVTGYTTSPAEGTTLYILGARTVTVSYTEDGITKTATFGITVSLT